MTDQLELFTTAPPVTAAVLKDERFFGKMDALCGLPLRGPESYARKISGARLVAYEEGYWEGLEAT